MEHDNTSYDVSDIQLPPSENLSPGLPPALPSTLPSSLPVYLQTQYYSYQGISPLAYYYPFNYFPAVPRYATPVPMTPQFFFPANYNQPKVQRPSVSQIISSIKSKAEVSAGNKRVSRFLSGIPPDPVPLEPKPELLITKKKCKKKNKKNRSSLAAELERMMTSQQTVPENDTRLVVVPKSAEWTAQHQTRLQRISTQPDSPKPASPQISEPNLIVGTCVNLEKDFYRITSNIDPSKVRPERILRKSLELVKEVWDDEGDYSYVSDQLKSIRQDLTVQGIRNEFAVTVYDAHARISLLAGDQSEFGQCLTQLRQLSELVEISALSRNELTSYYILNCVFTENYAGIMESVGQLSASQLETEFISSALRIQKAYETCNYSVFFKTHKALPGLGKYIVNWFADRFRRRVMLMLCQSYRPCITLEFVSQVLCFDDCEECLRFVSEWGAVMSEGVINCKETCAFCS